MVTAVWEDISLDELFVLSDASDNCFSSHGWYVIGNNLALAVAILVSVCYD